MLKVLCEDMREMQLVLPEEIFYEKKEIILVRHKARTPEIRRFAISTTSAKF